MASSSTATGEQISWAYGAIAGVVAYLLSYVLAYLLWAATEFPDTIGGAVREFVTGRIADWVFSGWLLYNAHFVDIAIDSGLGRTRWNFIDFVGQSSTDIIYIVVPGVLLVAGVALARATGVREAVAGAAAGASVVVGYLPLAVVGAFVFTAEGASPVLLQATLLAGIVYPVVVGAIGGGIAAELR